MGARRQGVLCGVCSSHHAGPFFPSRISRELRTRDLAYEQHFTYDAVGNRIKLVKSGYLGDHTITYSYNAADELTQSVDNGQTTTYQFDANGNMVSEQSPDESRSYSLDCDNRLVQATVNGETASYCYDSGVMLIRRTDADGTTNYLRDMADATGGQPIVVEYDAAGSPTLHLLDGPIIDEHLAAWNSEGSHWYGSDALMSVRNVSDSAAAVEHTRDYESFGTTDDTRKLGIRSRWSRLHWPVSGRRHSADLRPRPLGSSGAGRLLLG